MNRFSMCGRTISRKARTLTLHLWSLVFISEYAHAVRPFVTDDASVVGKKRAQLETWLKLEPQVFTHNALASVGPTPWLEMMVGGAHGVVFSGEERGYFIVGPLLQTKALFVCSVDNRTPGVSVAMGVVPPWGYGPIDPVGWGGYVYAALTQSFLKQWVLVHANIGVALGEDHEESPGEKTHIRWGITGGVGIQARVIGGLHVMGEVYYGDPADASVTYPAMQIGVRYVFSERVQLDGTFGSTLTAVEDEGAESGFLQWGTFGLRLVTGELW